MRAKPGQNNRPRGKNLRILLLGAVLGLLTLGAPARADWLNTHWRMSLAEVKALYPDATADPFFPPALSVKTPVDFLYHAFDLRLLVYQDALIGVRLTLLGEKGCANLVENLTRQYGKPSDIINGQAKDPVVKSWQWYLKDDDIALDLYSKGGCDLRYYDARITPKPSGLPL
jgi:hypothetical protein